LENVDPGHVGHADIEDREIERLRGDGLKRGRTVRADNDFVAEPREFHPHEFLKGTFVVHEQNLQFIVSLYRHQLHQIQSFKVSTVPFVNQKSSITNHSLRYRTERQ
jgi:hypothetical protein